MPSLGGRQCRRSIFGQSFEVGEINATTRSLEETGSRVSQKAREQHKVPSVLYGYDATGKEERVLLWLDELELLREQRKRGPSFHNTLYNLVVDGVKVSSQVLPRGLVLHPTTGRPECVSFLRYKPWSRPGARIEIPLRAINEDKCPGIKDGGWLLFMNYQIPVFARGETIPNCLIVDLRGKKVAEKIKVSEIHFNDGLMLRTKRTDDFAVAKIMGSKKLMGEEDAPAAAGAAAPAAAGAKKPAAGAAAGGAAPAAPAAAKK